MGPPFATKRALTSQCVDDEHLRMFTVVWYWKMSHKSFGCGGLWGGVFVDWAHFP